MEALSKEKDWEIVGEWIENMVNHLYLSATSTLSGDGEIIQRKWISLFNYIHNVHKGHPDNFPRCLHLSKFCEDVGKLSPEYQTFCCEAFYSLVTYSLVINFTP